MRKIGRVKGIVEKFFRHRIVAGILGVGFATLWVLSAELDVQTNITWGMSTFLGIVIAALILIPIFSFVITKLIELRLKPERVKYNAKVIFGIILVFNLLVWLALFPGMYGYDSVYQTRQFLEGGVLGTHYSVLYSYVLYLFASFGWVGYAILICLQIFGMTYVETRITTFVARKIRKQWAVYIIPGFYILQTMVKILIVSSCQDTIFGGLFALIMIHLIELADNTEKYLAKKRNLVVLPAMIFLMMAIRNNGFYVIVAVGVIGMIILRKYWRKVWIIFILPIMVYEIYTGPMFDLIGVAKDTDAIKEMNSIPAQQIARAFYEYPEKYSVGEKEELGKWFRNTDQMIQSYKKDPGVSDGRKNYTQTDYIKEHPLGYLKFWLKVGIKSPGSYVEGMMLTNMGYYYPWKSWNDVRQRHPLIETTATITEAGQIERGGIVIAEKSILGGYKRFLRAYVGDIKNINGVIIWPQMLMSVILQPGRYFVAFVIVAAVCMIRRKWRTLLPLGLVAGLYITLLLSPVVLFRYVFPVVLSAPLMGVMLFRQKKK